MVCTAHICKEISNESHENGQWREKMVCTAQISKGIGNESHENGQWRMEKCRGAHFIKES